jgi:two-component system sensor histidine kinase KdpD
MDPDESDRRPDDRWRPYLRSLALVAAATLPGLAVRTLVEPANLVMPYLLAVVLAALQLGRGPAVLAAVAGVLAFDFLMVPPFLTFAVDDIEYLITFAALLVVGLVISDLAARAKERADAALERAALAEELQRAKLREAREELQAALLQAMSHDLRTPLVSITGALSTLADESLPLAAAERRELVDNALEEAERLNRIVGDLLDVSRLEAGALPLRRGACDAADLVGAALSQLGERLAMHPVRTAVPAELPPVHADFAAITQVLVNLLENAAKYSPAGAPIDVGAREAAGGVRIEVADRGRGLPPEALERVFERGVRLAGPDEPGGTGLGLTICKGIVEAHGGEIGLAARDGGGLVAWLRLPAAAAAAGGAP